MLRGERKERAIHEEHEEHEGKMSANRLDDATQEPRLVRDTSNRASARVGRPAASTELLMRDEVFTIVGAAIEVHRVLGSGFLEAVYQEALQLELEDRKVPFAPQQLLTIQYKNRRLNNRYLVDVVCYGEILVELKALDRLTSKEEAQILNYLKASSGTRVALLINFGSLRKLEWKRFVL